MVAANPLTRSENATARARRRWDTLTDPGARAAATEAARTAHAATYQAATPPPDSNIAPSQWTAATPTERRALRMGELARRSAAARRRRRLAALDNAADLAVAAARVAA
jgi:hypothetical protein